MNDADAADEATPIMRAIASEHSLMAGDTQRDGGSAMSPRMVLLTFTTLNFLLYFDRGATAGALSAIRVDHHLTLGGPVLTDAKCGFLVSGFTIGYLCTSPYFASRGSTWGSRLVILLGMFLWCVMCLGCAVATRYWFLLLCRVLVGVGEAAFVGFTVTIIDNIAPPDRRTTWIGLFYSMIPVGTAVGMGCGGVLTSYPTLMGVVSWRLIYVGEVVAAVPVIISLCCIPSHYHLRALEERDAAALTFTAATVQVLRNTKFMLLVFGFATYCFVTGAVSTWGIPLLHEGPLQLSRSTAAVFMGLATTVSGVVGSLLGGLAVDYLGGSAGVTGAIQCQRFDIAMILIAIPSGAAALLATNAVWFGVAFTVAVVALFAISAPINASILTVVPGELRPYAISYSVFFIHLLGDFPSPTLAGLVSDYLGRECHALRNEDCISATPQSQCVWVTDAAAGHCTSRVQLRNALLLVFSYLLIAPPCWIAVWRQLQQEAREDSEDENAPAFPSDLSDSSPTAPPEGYAAHKSETEPPRARTHTGELCDPRYQV